MSQLIESHPQYPYMVYFSLQGSLVDLLLRATNAKYLAGYDTNGMVCRESYHSELLQNWEKVQDWQSLSEYFNVVLVVLSPSTKEVLGPKDSPKGIVVVEYDSRIQRYHLLAWKKPGSYVILIPMTKLTMFIS